jgi:AcrR family transcriptional regulator
MEKQSYHHGDLKAELISAGLKLLSEEGYAGFSLRKVARACGVSQTAPYRHFEDKDALVTAIMMQAMAAFNNSLEAAVNKHPGNPRSQIKEMGLAYIRFFVENPEYLRLMFMSDLKLAEKESICDGEGHLGAGHPFGTLFGTVRAYCEAYPDSGWGEQDLTVFCWGLVHGISVLLARGELPFADNMEPLINSIMWNEKFL